MASHVQKNCTYFLVLALSFVFVHSQSTPCIPREIEGKSIVCVCNATYCDTLEPLPAIPNRQFYHLESNFEGKRFEASFKHLLTEGPVYEDEALLVVNPDVQFQSMVGFGGAFTDAAGINFESVSEALRDRLMNAYFAKDGLEFNIARVPIGGTDFSTKPYTYCDEQPAEGDVTLDCFELQVEDIDYKIPYVKRGLAINPDIKLFASPWSAPAWMKSNNMINGTGVLKKENYQIWADYFIRFLDEYKENNINFWAVTMQNEPIHGFVGGGWNCMGWLAEMARDFIKNNLGPNLRASYPDVKLLIVDDQRFQVVYWLRVILGDPEAAQYVSGVGLHWYANQYFPPTPLDVAHREYPDYFMFNTEACAGFLHELPGVEPVDLGSWYRAELYAHNIIEDLNHWLTGWVDWNLVLDPTGGPNWAGNMVDAPIIVYKDVDEAVKQPMYYAFGHFSKYITEHSVRVHSRGTNMGPLQTLTVLRPDDSMVVVILNDKTFEVPLTIRDDRSGSALKVVIGSRSIHTIVYPSKSVNVSPAESTTFQTIPTEEEDGNNTITTTENGASANTSQFIVGISLLVIFNGFLAHWL